MTKHLPSYWTTLGDDYDCSGFIGQIDSSAEWPMYSFDRPAFIFWNGLANELHKAGWTDDQIKTWLQSKHPRWLLDQHDEKIRNLGAEFGKKIAKTDLADVKAMCRNSDHVPV